MGDVGFPNPFDVNIQAAIDDVPDDVEITDIDHIEGGRIRVYWEQESSEEVGDMNQNTKTGDD